MSLKTGNCFNDKAASITVDTPETGPSSEAQVEPFRTKRKTRPGHADGAMNPLTVDADDSDDLEAAINARPKRLRPAKPAPLNLGKT